MRVLVSRHFLKKKDIDTLLHADDTDQAQSDGESDQDSLLIGEKDNEDVDRNLVEA